MIEEKYIKTDLINNNNKFWHIKLLDDNITVVIEWGRVGKKPQSVSLIGGKREFDKRVKKQLKEGYVKQKTISSFISEIPNLEEIAKTQIKRTNSPILDGLISNLVKWNIHNIVNSTNITYDEKSGQFKTPLGIVSKEGIAEARIELNRIKTFFNCQTNPLFISSVNKYLSIIPQDIGMKFDVDEIFGGDGIDKQFDILDSLESSVNTLSTDPSEVKVNNVFNLEMNILNNTDEEFLRISKKFTDSISDIHSIGNRIKIKNIFSIKQSSEKEFNEISTKLGSIFELWHGTKKSNLLSILKNGLKISPPSTVNINGKMFGNGIYFASSSTKSINYSTGGVWDSYTKDYNCFLFVADVCMGKYYIPTSTYDTFPKPSYDSVWAKTSLCGLRNDEYIIYNENQYLLKYLIEFEPI